MDGSENPTRTITVPEIATPHERLQAINEICAAEDAPKEIMRRGIERLTMDNALNAVFGIIELLQESTGVQSELEAEINAYAEHIRAEHEARLSAEHETPEDK